MIIRFVIRGYVVILNKGGVLSLVNVYVMIVEVIFLRNGVKED